MELEASYHAAPAGTENPYQYNGQELHEDFGLGWYAYGARWYMPDVGRFPSIDRFAEKYAFQSPYTYAANNPIKYIDVNGDSIKINFNSKDSERVFKAFLNTKAGKEFVGQFAAKGQKIFGHTFSTDGKYHKKGIDLAYKDRGFGKGRENTGADTAGGGKGGNVVDDRLKLVVTINTTAEDKTDFDKVTDIVHESFLHVYEYSEDFSDNKKVDFSHDFYYQRLMQNSPSRRHHLLFHNKKNAYSTHPLYTQGSRVLSEYSKSNGLNYSHQKIFNALWNFAD